MPLLFSHHQISLLFFNTLPPFLFILVFSPSLSSPLTVFLHFRFPYPSILPSHSSFRSHYPISLPSPLTPFPLLFPLLLGLRRKMQNVLLISRPLILIYKNQGKNMVPLPPPSPIRHLFVRCPLSPSFSLLTTHKSADNNLVNKRSSPQRHSGTRLPLAPRVDEILVGMGSSTRESRPSASLL